ncbi:MAG: helix-turn-helix domain-containing protein [Sphingomonas bacterium]
MIQTLPHPRYFASMIYQPEYAEQAAELCRLGATDEELAEHFQVCVRTIYRWRNAHEAFAKAVIAGKEHADARVERSLYARAVGCSVERTKVFKHAGDPDPVYATYKHQLAPDPNAALQWLRVRQPRKWRIREEEKNSPGAIEMIERALARADEYTSGVVPFRPTGKVPAPFYVPDKARARAKYG